MNKKTLLGISLTAAFAVSMIFAQYVNANGDDHLKIEETAVAVSGDVLKASVTVEGVIPTDGSAGAFGYGFFTSGTNNVLALTTHLCASDSPMQGAIKNKECTDGVIQLANGALGNGPDYTEHADADFHAHVLDLKAADGKCDTDHHAPLEVDIEKTVAEQFDVISPDWPVKVSGHTIIVGNVDTSAFDDVGVEAVVPFTIIPTYTDDSIDELCVVPFG